MKEWPISIVKSEYCKFSKGHFMGGRLYFKANLGMWGASKKLVIDFPFLDIELCHLRR